MTARTRHRLDPDTRPPAVLHRDEEQARLHAATTEPLQHLYVHGPQGAGKTLLAHTALAQCRTTAHYLSCVSHNTQYKVLKTLCERISDENLNSGYHTAQLQDRLAHHLQHTPTVIVLDDLAFLLANDGNDLLYFLSRLKHRADLGIVGISASPTPLADHLDERTYSSLQPRQLICSPYAEDETVHILTQRAETALPPGTVEPAALEYIAATTTNLTLALHWLTYAATEATRITVDVLRSVQADAMQRYRDGLLGEFTWHHSVLLDVIDRMTADTDSVTTGPVYNRYIDYCRESGTDPLTARRIGDYLTHLELLHLIDVTHHRGGAQGKTREIRPTSLQEF
ncbi:AAA family ATPase [Natrinema sp. 1APR25-10V2]|uniref:Cdc6/Cdc18 family protein n=1 Tax=Natrinema sp. 1APR25-10V2 TaxID=2951081 RepID=UPI0028741ECC|nr:AAA family ATPase [Natrinema sp. 1APR25-10V2]MDS0476850.1 AAA family ATPase [Natrinema sp. 1APR25-10V2]